jgi:hypothetical protein
MSSASLAKMPTPTPPALAGSAPNAFVINLVSSTTPVALTRPDHAGLKRFTFFVSRRREDGRERFRLHMGYFDTQEQAEQLLDIVRTIYPGAWAGLAPGRRLAAAAAAAAEAAAAEATSAPAAPAPAITSAAPSASTALPPAAKTTAEMTVSRLALMPDEGRRPLADVEDVLPVGAPAAVSASAPAAAPLKAALASATARRTETAAGAEHRAARHSLRNIRDAIASLEDSGIHSPVLDSLPTLSPAVIPVAQPARAAPTARAAEVSDAASTLSNTATLRLLEAGTAIRETSASSAAAPVLAPATATQAAAAAAPPMAAAANAPRAEKPCFAVQLVWSVQPIDMAQIPQLAIFSAYSLYGAEGNRDGRRWYGLRLGFFTDAVSAKQVAQYVRSDFATVSVVPVTAREREQALKSTGAAAAVTAGDPAKAGSASHTAADTVRAVRAQAAAAPKARGSSRAAAKPPEFAFIEGTDTPAPKPGSPKPASAPSSPVAARMIGGRPTRGAPGKRVKVRKPGQVNASTPVKPKTLEETLEILGANQLQIDDETAASINDSGVRHLSLQPGKARPSKLSRLIGRLSERMGS